MSRYACAQWRELPQNRKNPAQKPRVLIFHTMSGYLRGTESTFQQSSLSSHFGVGGPWDGPALDGVAYQWMDTRVEAYAQFAGNHGGVSVETSDGGHDGVLWSPKQLDKLVEITVAFCKETGAPCELVKSPDGSGLGYHELFRDWNHNGHVCPGPVREKQLREVIIPRAKAILGGKPAPAGKPAPDRALKLGDKGPDVKNVEHALNVAGNHLAEDGVFGPATEAVVKKFQLRHGLTADGVVGPATWKALRAVPGLYS